MPDNVLDQVNFLVGADLTPYRNALRQAETEAQAAGQKIQSALSGGSIAGGGGGASSVSKFFSETEAGARKLIQARGALEDFGKGTSTALTSMHGATSTATREFRALFDELSSGRTRMVPGTLAIIATRVFGLSLGTLAWAAAIAAIPIAFAVAAVQAENALNRIQLALRRTGDATGATAAQIVNMARQNSSSPGSVQSVTGAATGLAVLAGRGNVSAAQLPGAEQAASGLALLTGQKIDKASEELEKALAQPAEGAKTLNEQMKLLSGAQTREVEDLAAMGEKDKAQQIIIDALNARSQDATSALGGFARALQAFGKGFADFWARMGNFGAGTPQEALTGVSGRIASLQAMLAKERHPELDKQAQQTLHALQTQQRALQSAVTAQNVQAASGAAMAKDSELVRTAMDKYRSKLDVARLKEEEKANAAHELSLAQGAAARELQRATSAHDAGAIAAAQKNLRDINDMAANAANPNYRWGSGVPKGHHPAVKDVLDTSDETVANAIKDELNAYLKLNQSLDARLAIQQEINRLEDQAKDAALRKELAEKHITGAAAQTALAAEKRAQQVRDQADAQQYRYALEDEQAKIDQHISGYQSDFLNSQEKMATLASQRLAIQLQLYDIETEQLRREMLKEIARDPNLTNDQRITRIASFELSRGAGRQALSATPETAAAAENQQLAETNSQLRIELSLKYADAELRAKELADLEAERQLKQEGWTADRAGYAQALADRRRLLEAQAQLNLALQDQTKSAQMLGAVRQGLEGIASAGLSGFKDLKQAASDFLMTLARMALQLYIMRPLLNMLLGQSGGAPGGLFGSFLNAVGLGSLTGAGQLGASTGTAVGSVAGSMFGGGLAAGGYTDPNRFYIVGENGPEMFRPGVQGAVVPLRAPSASQVTQGAFGGQGDINHNIAIQVSGNSDKQLMERVHAAASEAVAVGIKTYDQVQQRTSRARFVQSQRRALV